MKKKIHLILVEDHPEYREVIEMTLAMEPDMKLTGAFGSAEGALHGLLHLSQHKDTDIVLLDLNLPGMSGLEAMPLITEAAPHTKIIVLSQSDKEADVLQAITLGAAGYLLKSATDTQITEGIRIVLNGGASLDSGIARFILNALKEKRPKAPAPALSKREMEVLTLMAEGHVQKEIAERLAISNYTVNDHVNRIYEKLHVANAPAAVDKAHRFGLFQPNRE